MAAISYGIMFAPEVVWDPLTEAQKENLCNYLNKINEHPLPVCNWILFAVLVNIAMKKVGRRYSPEMLEEYLEGLETFYLGEGWYQDGDSGQKDYYISFAIHFYSLIYAVIMEKDDPERAKKYKARAMEFAKQFIYWFDEEGEAIPFGRSLTYRFSQVSFFQCLPAGRTGAVPGSRDERSDRKASAHLAEASDLRQRSCADHRLWISESDHGGAVQCPRFSLLGHEGVCLLLLPDDHPFWSVEEAPLPKLAPACPQKYADLFVYHYGNHTTAFAPGVYSPNGHGQIVAKYGKFAYDTRFSISVAKSCYELHENAPDNMLAFWIDGYVYVRRICEESKITENGVWSKWSPYPGITVETTITPDAGGHTRVHKITSEIDCVAYDCGFAVSRGDFEEVGFAEKVDGMSAQASNEFCSCTVSAVLDENTQVNEVADKPPVGYMITVDPNTNLLYTKTKIPAVKYHIRKGSQEIVTRVDAEVI